MQIRVFAVDPGTTTGWAFASNVDVATLPASECDVEFASGQLMGEEYQQSLELFRLIRVCWPCAIIIEDFIPRQLNKERHFLSPVRVTNQLTMLLYLTDRRWTLQQPSLAKSTISDTYLRSIMQYDPARPHANDAVRHILTFGRRVVRHHRLYDDLLTPLGLNSMTPTDMRDLGLDL